MAVPLPPIRVADGRAHGVVLEWPVISVSKSSAMLVFTRSIKSSLEVFTGSLHLIHLIDLIVIDLIYLIYLIYLGKFNEWNILF